MTEAAPAIFVALEASGLGAAIRQSRWLYMVANVGHIVSLMLFAGAIAVMDVRMAGALAATSPGFVLRNARRVAIAGFVCLAISGAFLFMAEASHVIINRVFQIKLGLIALGLVNIALFEIFIAPKVKDLPPLTAMPSGARAGAIASIAIWTAVAICGRSIAYF
ncbi:MAG: hypothetical protein V4661_11735 [Pseudomonadota bacterium]